jgi:hypothetical protein
VSKDSTVFLFSLLKEDSPLTIKPTLVIGFAMEMAYITVQVTDVNLAPLIVLTVMRATECCKFLEPRKDSALIM